LRFTYAQITFDADEVEATLRAVLMNLPRLCRLTPPPRL
jgi:hypothetical protein